MQQTRREWLKGTGSVLLATFTLAPASTATGGQRRITAFGGSAFGTYWRVSLPTGANRSNLRSAMENVIRSVDEVMSPFRGDTELSRFNVMRSVEPVPASPALHGVVRECLRIANLTNGAFDPTIGPLVNRFGFGPIRGNASANFAEMAAGSGTIRKLKPDVTIDLCGIAKGYALDRMADALSRLGHNDFVIELGGEVFARGSHPEGRPWRIAIEDPVADAGLVQRVIRLDGLALATSGDASNAYTVSGRRYSHIIDPRTAAPVDNGIASVSVIAKSAMLADGLATAFMALGPTRSAKLASRHGIPTLMLLRDGGDIRERAVAGFPNYIAS